MAGPRVETLGDAAILVTFGDRIDRGLNRQARAFAAAIDGRRADDRRIGRPVAAAASVLVPFDPAAIDAGEAAHLARETLGTVTSNDATEAAAAPPIEIAVAYGGAAGPDLEELAALHGLRPADVVELHATTTYDVFFLGFAPGFAYLGTVPAEIAAPRLDRPRERVPAGSVGIAGPLTAVYPFAMPGGWRLIGRTDAPIWETGRNPPALLAPGDRVRFVPVR